MTYGLSFFKYFQKSSFIRCPFCLTEHALKKGGTSCSACHEKIPSSFLKIPLRLIATYGIDEESSYDHVLLKDLDQGALKEKGLDLIRVSSHHPHLYLLSISTPKKLKSLCYIRFVRLTTLNVPSFTGALFLKLKDRALHPSSQELEHFFDTLERHTKRSFFHLLRKPPLCILNVQPVEDIVMSLPAFFSNLFEKKKMIDPSFFSAYVRSTVALWYGRRFLMRLENIFPSLF